MSNEVINAAVDAPVPNAVGALGTDALPTSTPEYAPATQSFVENVAEEAVDTRHKIQDIGHKAHETRERGEEDLFQNPKSQTQSSDSLSQQAYDIMVQLVSRDPRFEVNNNIRQVLQEVQQLRVAGVPAAQGAGSADLAAIRETVEHIWTHLQEETEGAKRQAEENRSEPSPTVELIGETRALVRSVNEEVNAVRNNTIQLTNQIRMVMDVATRCLREMDKTAVKYEQNGEKSALLDELRSLRDMLADGFENARLEPIAPEPGETFRYNEHRAENGFAASGKIKRTLYPGFRWTQPTPPVILLPAIVETE
jgi:uncharacterized coiled-coil DUF342 family protein